MQTLESLSRQISLCTRCSLRANATQPVPGLGEGKKYFILGEAPGKDEDHSGVPFVGLAGRRLDKLIKLAGIELKDCYITNVVKCRPPKNRDPRKAERLSCYGWLAQELKIVRPENIIALGRVPASLFSEYGIAQLHGTQATQEIDIDGEKFEVNIIFNFHPAAALHQPRLWAVMLDDWANMPEKVDAGFTIVNEQPKFFSQMIALDTETDNMGGVGQWSVAYRDGEGRLMVVPFQGAKPNIQFNGQTIFHNAKYDIREMRKAKMNVPKPENVLDTMIAAYCLGMGRQEPKDTGKSGDNMVGGLGLKYLARRHLGLEMKTWEQIKDRPELVPEYNAMDSVATYLLFEKWKPTLPQHFWDIDMPLLDVLMAMEDRGIKVDPDFIQEYAKSIDAELDDIQLPFNPFANDKIIDYVYGTLGYPVTKKTPTGKPSVEKEILETIDDPIIRGILKYKEFSQEKKTYIGNYINRMDLGNRVHCDFKQTSTTSGRLSSARPNLQNVAKKYGEGDEKRLSKLRDLFVAEEGKLLVRIDYDQLELRVLAAYTQDPTMLEALASGKKIHQATADALSIAYDDAKIANFLTSYAGTAWAISREMHIPIDKAKQFQADYFAKFPGVKVYQDEQRARAVEEHKVSDYYGRTRRIDEMYSDEWKVQQDGIRMAINMPIQGTAAEVVKLAMIRLHYDYSAPMILQVHDELLFEVPEKEAEEYAHWLEEYIPTLVEIEGVRFPVDIGIGRTWLQSMEKK